jgi:hypothetical protein
MNIDRTLNIETVHEMRRLQLLVAFAVLTVISVAGLYVAERHYKGVYSLDSLGMKFENLRQGPQFPGNAKNPQHEESQRQFFGKYNSEENLGVWLREGWFYNYSNYLREGVGPDIPHKPTLDDKEPNAATRILVIGDSIVFGTGLSDREVRWPNKLEQILNAETTPGTFKVDSLGRDNASAIEEIEWLTRERMDTLDPDLIVISYFMNDPVPSYREEAICKDLIVCRPGEESSLPGYQKCINGQNGAFPIFIRKFVKVAFPNLAYHLLLRNCDANKLAAQSDTVSPVVIQREPRESPFWPQMQETIRSLPERVGDIPVIFAPVHTSFSSVRYVGEVVDVYREAGAVPAPMNRSLALIGREDFMNPALWSNPSDSHPGPVMNTAIAADVAEKIFELLAKNGVQPATVKKDIPVYPIVSNFYPFDLEKSITESSVKLTYNPQSGSTVERFTYIGDELPQQHVPCALLGRPHAQVVLEPTRDRSKIVRIDVGTAPAQGVELFVFSHPVDFRKGDIWGPTISSVGRYRTGDVVELPADLSKGRSVDGFLVAEVDNLGCALDRELQMSSFSLRVFSGQ